MAAIMLAGVGLTALGSLVLVILGIAVVTFGFFGGHTVASSWIGLRARHAKAQASGLYFFFYYMGSSVAGAVGGIFWDKAGWPGVAGFVAVLVAIALIIAARESRRRVLPATIGRQAV
jgi:YNFM family putative membrane transporter